MRRLKPKKHNNAARRRQKAMRKWLNKEYYNRRKY